MSDHGFQVHGPHDHALEHAAHEAPGGFSGRLAVITAVLATIGSIFSYMGGATQAHAGMLKNDAAIKKTEAANQWAFYQAKSNRQNLSELGFDLAPEPVKAKLQAEVARYKSEKDEIKALAERLEAESAVLEHKSAQQLHEHHRWAQSTTVLQISIAMAAIALLTGRRWLLNGVIGLGVIGTAIGALAWMGI
jgi:lipopolysaccharide export LptBFGC system permease protein LptF